MLSGLSCFARLAWRCLEFSRLHQTSAEEIGLVRPDSLGPIGVSNPGRIGDNQRREAHWELAMEEGVAGERDLVDVAGAVFCVCGRGG